MTRPPYRLLACDLDGTILQHDRYIRPRVKRAISSAQERGVRIVLATGRSFQSALPYARLMGVHLPLICYQGGLVQHPDNGHILYQASLAPELIEETIELGQTHDWQLIVYTADEIILTEYRYPQNVYSQMLGPTVRLVEDLRTVLADSPIKLTIMAKEKNIPAIEEEMNRRFSGRMEIVRSHSMFVEAIPSGASKGSALAWLANHLGVSRSEVIAIGDQDNDASMVTWAGLGVAMGNGSPQCKRAADWIAPSIDADGSAVAIERFLLKEIGAV